MIEKQFNLTGDTFILMEYAINKLNDMDFKLKVMKVNLNNIKTRLSKTNALLNNTVSTVNVLRDE